MELHPYLEPDIRPAPKWWYVFSAIGDCPSVRVGHSITFVPALHSGEHSKVFLIGGANPSQVFAEVYVLDLHTRSWDILEAIGFRGRYEHAAFTVSVHLGKIFVFGGATQTGNLNDIQSLDVASGSWSDVETEGTPPSPRTHRCSAVSGGKFYVYSGGHCGSDPVGDRRVHCLDTVTMQWSSLTPKGDPPKPRHGHFMASIGSRIYLHGGMAGTTFYDDLHILDLEKNSWTAVKKKKTSPPPRAAHDGICYNNIIYIFGGMSKAGALDDAYILNTDTNSWSKLEIEGPTPANRLDFGLCRIKLHVPLACLSSAAEDAGLELNDTSARAREVLNRELKPGSASSRDSDSGSVNEALYALDVAPTQTDNINGASGADGDEETAVEPTEEVDLILINGGMDTEGEIFDDTLVLLL